MNRRRQLLDKQRERELAMAKKEQARLREEQKLKDEKLKEYQEKRLKELSVQFEVYFFLKMKFFFHLKIFKKKLSQL